MDNHVHMSIETNEETNLSKLMKRVNLSYYQHYKRKYGYAGHFWQDRFKTLLIEKDSYLISCGIYIERNPVRARMVKNAEEYPYSSYGYYAYGKEDQLLDRDVSYDEMGSNDLKRQDEYRKLILTDEERIHKAIGRQLFLGSDSSIKEMEDKFGVKNNRMEQGRPKKNK